VLEPVLPPVLEPVLPPVLVPTSVVELVSPVVLVPETSVVLPVSDPVVTLVSVALLLLVAAPVVALSPVVGVEVVGSEAETWVDPELEPALVSVSVSCGVPAELQAISRLREARVVTLWLVDQGRNMAGG
jgi:hypothetical protein